MRRDEPTNKFENVVPGGLVFGPLFRLRFSMSTSRLADCAAFRVVCFPLDFDLRLTFCKSLRNGTGEGVNPYWSDVDELEAKLGAMVNGGARAW